MMMRNLKVNKYILFIFITFIIVSCDMPFNFKRDKTLIEEYQYTQHSEVILIYYNVIKSENKKNISMAIKNISGTFLADLSIFLHIDKPVRVTNYINLGNLKNRSVKYANIDVPIDTKQIFIDYEYTPVNEDEFLQFDSGRSYSDYRRFSDTITLFLP
jgi:hypothetical protein